MTSLSTLTPCVTGEFLVTCSFQCKRAICAYICLHDACLVNGPPHSVLHHSSEITFQSHHDFLVQWSVMLIGTPHMAALPALNLHIVSCSFCSYEAWVIYNFLSLCLAYVGGPGAVEVKMNGYILMPSCSYMTCCLPPLMVNGRFVRQCKQGALQFVLLKPILAVVILVLYTQGKYTEGDWGVRDGCALYTTMLFAPMGMQAGAAFTFCQVLYSQRRCCVTHCCQDSDCRLPLTAKSPESRLSNFGSISAACLTTRGVWVESTVATALQGWCNALLACPFAAANAFCRRCYRC